MSDDVRQLVAGERVELDDLVEAVDELGLEVRLGTGPASRNVRGHDQHGVLEVDRAALAVGQPAVVHDLQQDPEHVGVGLLDLVEQDHGVGAAADGLGELAALVVAHVARGRADEPRDRVLLHVLRHVDADHRVLRVEHELGQRAGQLGLAHAGRARGRGRCRSGGSGSCRPARERRIALATASTASSWPMTRSCRRSSMWTSFSTSPSMRRETGMPVQRPTTSATSSASTTSLRNLRLDAGVLGAAGLLEMGLELGDRPVLEPAGALVVGLARGPLELRARLLELLLELAHAADGLLLALPLGRHGRRALLAPRPGRRSRSARAPPARPSPARPARSRAA